MAKRDEGIYLFLILSLAIFVPHLANATVPAIFVLGDSTADVGTNSFLPDSLARADFRFNGIDFPHSRSTGRFSNGFNSADFLGGQGLILFASSKHWFCFGSLVNQANGVQEKPTAIFISSEPQVWSPKPSLSRRKLCLRRKVVPLSEQIMQFATVRHNLTALRGLVSTEKMLSRCCISIGRNHIFGYFLTNSTVPKEEFITILMNTYELHIKSLYSLGARKFGTVSVPPIWHYKCATTGGCLEAMNDFSRAFYSALNSLLCKISSELPGMK